MVDAWARDKPNWQILVLCRSCAHAGVLTVRELLDCASHPAV